MRLRTATLLASANSLVFQFTIICLFATTCLSPTTALAVAEIERGKAVYDGIGACGTCHGPTGAGDGAAAAALNPKPRGFNEGVFSYDTDNDGKTGTEADIINIIRNGAQPYGGSMMMVARKDLSDDDVKALAKYVLSLVKTKK